MKRQAFWMLVTRGLGGLCQALLFALLARAIDTVAFGEINVLLGIAIFLGVLADLGLSSFIVKAYAIDGDFNKVEAALRVNGFSTLAFTLLLSAIYLSAAGALGLNPWLVLIVCWIAVEKNIEAQLCVFIAQQDVLAPAISITLRRVIPVLCFLPMTLLGVSAEISFCVSLLLGAFLGQVHASIALRPHRARWMVSRIHPMSVIREALPFSLTNIAGQARNLDTPIVAFAAGTAAAGLFAASSKAAIPVFLVATAIGAAVMPAVAKGGRAFSRRLLRGLVIGLVTSCGIAVLALPFADRVMTLIYGYGYARTGSLFILIVLGIIFAAAASPLIALSQAHGGTRETATIGIIFAVLLLGGIAGGSTIGGLYGAGWAALLVYLSRTVVLILVARTRIGRD